MCKCCSGSEGGARDQGKRLHYRLQCGSTSVRLCAGLQQHYQIRAMHGVFSGLDPRVLGILHHFVPRFTIKLCHPVLLTTGRSFLAGCRLLEGSGTMVSTLQSNCLLLLLAWGTKQQPDLTAAQLSDPMVQAGCQIPTAVYQSFARNVKEARTVNSLQLLTASSTLVFRGPAGSTRW